MKFTIVALFASVAFAGYDAAPGPSQAVSDPASGESKPTAAPLYSSKPESCETYTETCTVTVTVPKKSYGAANATAPVHGATGTVTPVQPTKAYYSNAANSMVGGAFAVGAGALAALFL